MRLVFFGSGGFAVPSLRAVVGSRHELAAVVTQPARPAGRGGKVRRTEVACACEELGLPVTESADVNTAESLAALRALRPDVLCVADFGQMLSPALLVLADKGAVNVHGSLLPALRGAAPINWAIIRGLPRTGVTTFRIVRRMDAGPIYLQAETDIAPDETAEDLEARLAEMGAVLLVRTLDLMEEGGVTPREQDAAAATLAPQLAKSDGIIDWTAGAEAIGRLIRGTWPWPGGQTVYRRQDGRGVPVTIASAGPAGGQTGGPPGTLDAELLVATGQGRLQIARLRPAGKRLMEWRDFVNGYRVQPGDRFVQEGT